ncbi:hypothetical protein [Staphylococcus equorum]|uniref:hypothetical protein n=1 Tax=Staphylococcus equorum TaxID=246432 RepID=UPI000853565B|nr:hypothetical protein [Staphylococcus equorum]OEL08246.1 hypothetical protein AST04_08660 [Staphylococcus equorum]
MAIDREHAQKIKDSKEQSQQELQNMQSEEVPQTQQTEMMNKVNIPKKAPIEKKKNYTFSLLPSVRANIVKMADENNYKSSSELLNTLFKEEN